MTAAERLFHALENDFGISGAKGELSFRLKDYHIVVEQNNVIGSILEEWLGKWMNSRGIPNEHNTAQSSPDFWLNPDNKNEDWLEVKAFTGSPNFDVAAFRSFIQLAIDKPWKLHSQHLLLKYKMQDGIVTVENCWLKNLWEICSSSASWPVKVQCKRGIIFNIRPATWYAVSPSYPAFSSLEHFLAAVEETIYKYHDTRATIAEHWTERLIESYRKHYGRELIIPRWNDIKNLYLPEQNEP